MPQQNMEKFKVCEKEMKTKAFSKEGLQQAALAKDEDPNTETKKWYGYLSVPQSPSSSSAVLSR
jgi:CCR4-NOT transcriptional regulation complex NOT5 subunit